ncbi:MAG: carbohydrate ABC transporter permease [Alphaproteobacteria bacterium]|nr:carbohydrate ABC transporter permease [Alphaproteobacteria bacterium]
MGLALAVVVVVSPAILVFLWMLSLSMKTELENSAFPPVFVPAQFSLENFAAVIKGANFGKYLWNSLVVSGASTLAALILGVPAGYGIARARANGLAAFILVSRVTPGMSYLIPMFILFRYLDLIGTLAPMIIIHMVITLPIVVWVMIGFFETLPVDLEEAATIDGCNTWQNFWHIALPLSRPGITVATILGFIFSWNNFVFGIVLTNRETRTLPVAVYNSMSFEQISWGPLAASALIVTLPVLVLTIVAQKEIVHGLTAGGLKGG